MAKPIHEEHCAPRADASSASNRVIGSAMASVLPLWSVPPVVEAQAGCGTNDRNMARSLLRLLERDAEDETVDALFACFASRYRLGEIPLSLPHGRRAAQLLATYAFGRFVLLCAQRRLDVADASSMTALLTELEPEVWDATGVISFYETTMAATFPVTLREPFGATVRVLSSVITGRLVRVPRPRPPEPVAHAVTWATSDRTKLWN